MNHRQKNILYIFFSIFFLMLNLNSVEAVVQNGSRQQQSSQASPAATNLQQQNINKNPTQDPRAQARQRIINAHTNRLQNRFRFYYQRLTQIASKLELRLNTMAETGTDVDQAQLELNQALATLEDANTLANEAVSQLGSVDVNNYADHRKLALQAKDDALQTTDLFKEALAHLKTSVSLAQQANNDNESSI